MSLKRNVAFSYFSQLYATIIAIIMVPVYIRYMGIEAYGLVSVFATMQVCFQLLDFGLTPTVVRETARFSGGAISALSLRTLLRSFEGIFLLLGLSGALVVVLGSSYIASEWLNADLLPVREVQSSVAIMGIIAACRWMTGLYRGLISGFERLYWLSIANVVSTTTRSVFLLPVFLFLGSSPKVFFLFQLVVAVAELLSLITYSYRLLPLVPVGGRVRWRLDPARAVLKFSATIAVTTSMWIVITQTDKLLLSKLISLQQYGYFSLAVTLAGGILTLTGPISSVLLPRLTRLVAESEAEKFALLYRAATQYTSAITIAITGMFIVFAEEIIWVWSGDLELAKNASAPLRLYAAGNCFLVLSAFPYYVQYARGDLKLHLLGNIIFIVIYIPCLLLAVHRFGIVGAGYAWLLANIIPFVLWIPLVHRRFLPGLHSKWLLNDVVATMTPATIGATIGFLFRPEAQTRVGAGLFLALSGAGLLGLAFGGASVFRARCRELLLIKRDI